MNYTGVRGGAAAQLARKLGIGLVDLTRDGNTARGVLADLARAPAAADVVTLTAGGNDSSPATSRARSSAGFTRSRSG
jgi:lysophospholipase L1-like esterase